MITEFTGKYRFLSNFAPSVSVRDGFYYPSVEHAYQAAKASEEEGRRAIQQCVTAGKAKQLGRKIAIRADWEQIKLRVMLELLRDKFKNQRLRGLLLETGDQELVESNWWGDKFWGKCAGEGENHLGRLLMQVRDEIRGELECSENY